MRIAVMGTGGTGGYFGGLLARTGEDVAFIARGSHLAALQEKGLRVTSQLSGDFALPVRATNDPATVGPVDLVLFCVKTYDTHAAAELMRPLIEPETVVLPVQNGIDSAEQLAPFVGREHIIGGVAQVTAAIQSPGVIVQTAGPGKILLGELAGGTSPRTEHCRSVLQKAGIAAAVHPDIRIALWEKFIFICAFSGLTALTRLPIGTVLSTPEGATLVRGVMNEVAAVAEAMGVGLPDETTERSFALVEGFAPGARGSLYTDLAAGRRLELETLNGTVLRLGRKHGIATPFNFVIYAALQHYVTGASVLP